MKVLLINPPSENTLTTEVPSFVGEERGYNPPLGIMYLAAYAEKNTEHKIEILDSQVEEIDYLGFAKEINKRKPDVVGISAMTFTLIDALKTAEIVKELDKGIKVIFGGPHTNIYPEETINLTGVDFVIRGE